MEFIKCFIHTHSQSVLGWCGQSSSDCGPFIHCFGQQLRALLESTFLALLEKKSWASQRNNLTIKSKKKKKSHSSFGNPHFIPTPEWVDQQRLPWLDCCVQLRATVNQWQADSSKKTDVFIAWMYHIRSSSVTRLTPGKLIHGSRSA